VAQQQPPTAANGAAGPIGRGVGAARRLLGPLRIRKKLFLLHTAFSAVLGALLFFALRPAIHDLVRRAEAEHALLALSGVDARSVAAGRPRGRARVAGGVELVWGSAGELGLAGGEVARAQRATGAPVPLWDARGEGAAAMYLPHAAGGTYYLVRRRLDALREAVGRLDAYLLVSLVGVYALIAAALELFVLPRNVYQPIARMLAADHAVRTGDRAHELIDESLAPQDELGEIMRSRNRSIRALRQGEAELARTLAELERVAGDLKRKNHLLENARRNLADADRLASLGMLSAGIAHELNTPLAVAKGLVREIADNPGRPIDASKADLLSRVIGRLERLGEGLLDFARVRSPRVAPAELASLLAQALELLRLDESVRAVAFEDRVRPGLTLRCDPDRMVQVLVNLVRNAAEAVAGARVAGGRVVVEAARVSREDSTWVSITITDNGPGIAPHLLPSLFEPFVTSRLDAKGTGLGLAVADGIVREHGGVLLARNVDGGAQFEVLMPDFRRGPQSQPGAGSEAGPDR